MSLDDWFFCEFVRVYNAYVINMACDVFGEANVQLGIKDEPEDKMVVRGRSLDFMQDVKELLESTRDVEYDEDAPLTYSCLKRIERAIDMNKQRETLQSHYRWRKAMLDDQEINEAGPRASTEGGEEGQKVE